MFCVYALMDPRKPGPFVYKKFKFEFEPFYIGKGRLTRPNDHIKQAINTKAKGHKLNKIRKILKEGYHVEIRVVKRDLSEEEAFKLENKLVVAVGRSDQNRGPLTNKSDGGEGNSGVTWTPSSRKKLLSTLANRSDEALLARKTKVKAKWASKPKHEIDLRTKAINKALRNKSLDEKAISEWNRLKNFKKTHLERGDEIRKGKQEAWAKKTPDEVAEIVAKRKAAISAKERKAINLKLKAVHAQRTEKEKALIRAKRSEAVKLSWEKRRLEGKDNKKR